MVFTLTAQNAFTLKNSNTQTRGVTKIKLTHQSKGKVQIKLWGKCHPNDCYWGNFSTKLNPSYKEYMQRTKKYWIPRYNTFTINKSHVTRKVTIYKHRSNAMYKVSISNDFKNAKKKDTKNTYYMK